MSEIVPLRLDVGIVVDAVIADVPLPYTYPVSVVAPVPPSLTGTTPSEMVGDVPPLLDNGALALTDVTYALLPVKAIVWLGQEPETEISVPPVSPGLVVPVPPWLIGTIPVTFVNGIVVDVEGTPDVPLKYR